MKLHRSQRGLTLIEVMLAVALLATITVILWGTVSTSFKIRNATIDKFERNRVVQQAMGRMVREIATAFITTPNADPTNNKREVMRETVFDGTDDELNFTGFCHVRIREDEVAGVEAELTYRIESMTGDDGKIHRNLVRREDAPIDAHADKGGVVYTMVEDVEDVRFEYWDGSKEIAGEAWAREWDASAHDGQLPSRVRITLKVKHPLRDDRSITMSTQTTIALTEPIDPFKIAQDEARGELVNRLQEALEQRP